MKRFLWSKLVQRGESFHIGRAALDGRNAAAPHKQDFPEVFWIEQGQTLHTVNGRESLLDAGDMVFVRSTDSHSLAATSRQGFVLVNIAFPRATLDFIKARYFPSDTRWFWKKGPLPETTRLSPARLEWLAHWVCRLDTSRRDQGDIDIFLLELFRELGNDQESQNLKRGPDWLLRGLNQLKNPEIFSGGTEALARSCGRTSQHVNASLQRFHGITATEAVNAARMEFAARELRTGTNKILEICYDCGFTNLAHFYTTFKKTFGTTPRSYRLKHQFLVR
jgi:AraC family cel operon transcriptional repressor